MVLMHSSLGVQAVVQNSELQKIDKDKFNHGLLLIVYLIDMNNQNFEFEVLLASLMNGMA